MTARATTDRKIAVRCVDTEPPSYMVTPTVVSARAAAAGAG